MNENDGLIYSYMLDGKGGGSTVSWKEIDSWSGEKGVLWLHMDCGKEDVRQWLFQKSGIDEITCQALLSGESRPRYVNSREGLLLILRGVNCNPGADPDDMVSVRLWIDGDWIISVRHRWVKSINDISDALARGEGPASPGDFLNFLTERLTDRIGEVISDISEKVDELEDSILTIENHELRAPLAHIRRQIIFLRKFIAPQKDVLARLQNEKTSWLEDGHKSKLREVSERLFRYVEDLDSAREHAAITNEELNGKLSEQMSGTMYLLSIVAALFLPLGFITGLLGINVAGMPGTENKWAFGIVCVLVLLVGFVEYYVIKKKRWL